MRSHRVSILSATAGLLAAFAPGFVLADTADDAAPDSLPAYAIAEPVLVSAAKLPVALDRVAGGLTLMDRRIIEELPARTLPELLSGGAGMHAYDLAGNGQVATAETRGFSSLGETSHLGFLVDGIPMGDFATDRAVWDLFDVDHLERVELLRGAGSMLHGNAAFAGAVNLVPLRARTPASYRLRLGGGSHGRLDAALSGAWRHHRGSQVAAGRWREIEGWRARSAWSGGSFYGGASIAFRSAHQARLGLILVRSEAELPGPLTEAQIKTDPSQAAYALDRDEASRGALYAIVESSEASESSYRLSIHAQAEDRSRVETLLDTQTEQRDSKRLGAQIWRRFTILPAAGWGTQLLVGLEGDLGDMDTEFHALNPDGGEAALTASARVSRKGLAEFVRLEQTLAERWQLALGLRRDDIRADIAPAPDDPLGIEASVRDMAAFSPVISLNVRWLNESDGQGGNAYLLFNRSFKTPTLTQLYGIRPFSFDPDGPGEIPEMTITLANDALDPQRATQLEFGLRGRGPWGLRADLALFHIQAEDEIGFDLAKLRYANFTESTHRGLEFNLQWRASIVDGLRLFGGYALNEATFDAPFGEFGDEVVGKQINNVPRHHLRAGFSVPRSRYSVGAVLTAVGGQYADELNGVPLPDYRVLDLEGELRLRGQRIYLRLMNALDEDYRPAGYLGVDRTGQPVPLFFPAPGRRLEAGLRLAWR